MEQAPKQLSRRNAIKLSVLAAAGLAFGGVPRHGLAARQAPLITKPIPSSRERIPVVGLGTNRYGAQTPEELAPRREVLRRLSQLGGSVVDTAPSYGGGRAEGVIGRLVSDIGNRKELFIATKATARGNDVDGGVRMLEESFRRLRTDRIELMQVHNLIGTEVLLPVLREWKRDGRLRYIGITTSTDAQYEEMEAIMRKEPLDFIQIDYSVVNRTAARRLLPLAADRGMAVLNNVPFGGRRGNVLPAVAQRPLPAWAAEIGCSTWAQLCLKYNVSHPAVTCAIPGTTRPEHMENNLVAARGALPDGAMRRRIERIFDSL